MIRAVIDTNLIVSYLLTQSATLSRLIDHWEQGHYGLMILPSCWIASWGRPDAQATWRGNWC